MVVVLGWAAAVIGCCISLPQLIRLIRSGSVSGVSLAAWQIMLGTNITWCVHGVITGHANLWAPNALLAVCTVAILSRFRQHRGTSWYRLLAPGIALAATAIVLDLAVGELAFALAAAAPSVVSMLAQLVALVRAPDLGGVSLAYLVINLVNQVLWVGWAVLAGDRSVVGVGTTLGVLWVLILGWATLRTAGAVGPLGLRLVTRPSPAGATRPE